MLSRRTQGAGWSDHESFWLQGVPAILVTDTAAFRDARYHTPRDDGSQIDYVALARVVDIEGSGPRDPGAAMAVNEVGEVVGSVSGGCVEGAVVSESLSVLQGDRDAGIITFGYSDDEAFAVGLTCGGTIRLFIEELDW